MMDHSSGTTFYLLIIVILLLLGLITLVIYLFYYYQKTPKQESVPAPSTTVETAPEPSEPEVKTSPVPPPPPERKIPRNDPAPSKIEKTGEAFEETQGITPDDFIDFQGTKVLLVEDNLINQKIVINVLNNSGIDISVADNGQEALDLLKDASKSFDLVLMDISMPVMDGFEATRLIREIPELAKLPIVTFTAFSMGKEIKQMYNLGANGHITKPLNYKRLYTVFHTYLKHAPRRELSRIELLKTKGLDTEMGLKLMDENESVYRDKLREFLFLNKNVAKEMNVWIDNKNYDKIQMSCIKLSSSLGTIGAYELDELVSRMKKTFIYKTEHRMDEFKEPFTSRMEKLMEAIQLYLGK